MATGANARYRRGVHAADKKQDVTETRVNVQACGELPAERGATAWSKDARRQQLLRWFRATAPSLSDAYAGAVLMIEDVAFPGRLSFVAHAVRDILNRLPEVLDPQVQQPQIDYVQSCDRMLAMWPGLGQLGQVQQQALEPVLIEYGLAVIIHDLLERHRGSRRRPSKAELLFRILMRNDPSGGDVNRRLVADLRDTQAWFMRHTHLRVNPIECSEEDLKTWFRSFELMLHSFVGEFYTATEELDSVLDKANG